MTAPALLREPDVLYLPEPLPHQLPELVSDRRRKICRKGRRTGKTRFAFIAAMDGHGPRDPETNEPLFPGVLQGGDVVWVAKDYPQLGTVLWNEEIVPRFEHLDYVHLNKNEHTVSVDGLGTLYLRPETAINGIRGIGKNLKGVILDEAAFYDLESALQDVILPALLDNDGWLIIMSTTNVGDDGNPHDRVPSYFNVICEQIAKGERSDEWWEFTGTAFDNPTISERGIRELIAEYTPGSLSLQQEVYAALAVQGGRYYDVNAKVHLVPPADLPTPLPKWWELWGALDWGFAHWTVFGLFAKAGDAVFLLDSVWMRRQQDDALAEGVISLLGDYGIAAPTLVIYAGHDCWQQVTARGASGVTTADVFASRKLFLTKADIDKVNGGRAVQRALAHADDSRRRGFYIVDRPPRPGEVEYLGAAANRRVFDSLASILPDKNDVRKPRKVDADENGKGGDDGGDMARYGLATRYSQVTDPDPLVEASAFDAERLKATVDHVYRVGAPTARVPHDIDPFGGF